MFGRTHTDNRNNNHYGIAGVGSSALQFYGNKTKSKRTKRNLIIETRNHILTLESKTTDFVRFVWIVLIWLVHWFLLFVFFRHLIDWMCFVFWIVCDCYWFFGRIGLFDRLWLLDRLGQSWLTTTHFSYKKQQQQSNYSSISDTKT